MRFLAVFLLPCFLFAQADRDFGGLWKFNPGESVIHDAVVVPSPQLTITQSASVVAVVADIGTVAYPLNGKPGRSQLRNVTASIVTKWEGESLLASVLVSGSQNYSVRERWTRSRDGNRLTIEKTISRANSESESTLVYDNPNAVMTQLKVTPPAVPAQPAAVAAMAPSPIVLPAGTRILLRLTNAVNTKHTTAGDRLYLETAVPVFINRRLVIPARSYVTATVLESQRAGRVKGTSALNFRFDTLTLPNGVTRDFRFRAGSVDTAGNLDRAEGNIKGEADKGGDAAKVARTTATGAGIGTLAGAMGGRAAMGAGIGAAAGAIGGLAGILASRGADVVLPAGTSMEMVLDRELQFTEDELRRIQ